MPSSTSSSRDRRRAPDSRFLPGPRPRRIAHRGLALEAPANTLGPVPAALAAGAARLATAPRAGRASRGGAGLRWGPRRSDR